MSIVSGMTNTKKAPLPDFYTKEEVAAMFKISRSYAYQLRKKQNWPLHRIGHEVRFSLEDIEAIKAMGRKTPQPAPSEVPGIGVSTRRRPRIGTRAPRPLG